MIRRFLNWMFKASPLELRSYVDYGKPDVLRWDETLRDLIDREHTKRSR